MSDQVLLVDAVKHRFRTSEPTNGLRFAVPDGTTAEPPRLQQCWHWRDGDQMGFEWRDVPTEVVAGLPTRR